jgi:hypothetical protein
MCVAAIGDVSFHTRIAFRVRVKPLQEIAATATAIAVGGRFAYLNRGGRIFDLRWVQLRKRAVRHEHSDWRSFVDHPKANGHSVVIAFKCIAGRSLGHLIAPLQPVACNDDAA